MASAEELLAREQAAWDAMWEQVERVPEGERVRAGVVGYWSTQDVVWHCAYWADFCGGHLEGMGAAGIVGEGHGPLRSRRGRGRV